MPYVAPGLAVKWLSKMLTLIMADMAVSGPKLATFVKRLTCKWSAPLCIKPSRWERSPQRRQYICQCDRLASFCWGRRVPPPACCQTISQSVKLASLSLRMRTNANVNVVTSCPAIRSGDRVIHPSIACTVQVQWKIVCVARIWWTIKTPSIKASVANSRPHPIYALPLFRWSVITDRWSVIADRWSGAWFMHALFVWLSDGGPFANPNHIIANSYIWQCLGVPPDPAIPRSRDLSHRLAHKLAPSRLGDLSRISVSFEIPASTSSQSRSPAPSCLPLSLLSCVCCNPK